MDRKSAPERKTWNFTRREGGGNMRNGVGKGVSRMSEWVIRNLGYLSLWGIKRSEAGPVGDSPMVIHLKGA